MTRIIDPLDQFFDDAGDPLVNGLLYFYETGTNTPLNTYADVNLTIPNANPLPLTGAGRCPNAYGSNQLYRVVLKTADGVQIMQRDNVGSTGAEGNFTAWNNERTYNYPEIVQYANKFYMSATNGNQDNTPDTATQWIQIRFFNEYEATFSYSADDYVTYNGILYVSVAGSNLGNAPSSTPNKWQKVNGLPVWGNATNYQLNDVVYSGSDEYQSLQNNNLNHVVTDSAWWVKRKKFEVWNSGKSYASGDYVYDGELRYISKQSSNTNHQPSADTSETWWKPDWQGYEQLALVNSVSGGGSVLKVRMLNSITDGLTYTLPAANSVPNKTPIWITKLDRYRGNIPVVNAYAGNTITYFGGTDTSITFNYAYKTDIVLISDGVNTWSM